MVRLDGEGEEERLTPPDIDVFTPATSHKQDWVAVASPDKDGNRCPLRLCSSYQRPASCLAASLSCMLGSSSHSTEGQPCARMGASALSLGSWHAT